MIVLTCCFIFFRRLLLFVELNLLLFLFEAPDIVANVMTEELFATNFSSAFPQDPDATRFIQELADAKPHVLNAGR